jgi:rSAM-associated Gly-rich repeat protein
MANSDRRQFLKGLLGALAGTAGTAVVASAATTEGATDPAPRPSDIQERADRLAETPGTESGEMPIRAFVNAGFRNGVGGGFRNGGFANGFGGGFRNGGFRNGVGGGFRNGAFRNW